MHRIAPTLLALVGLLVPGLPASPQDWETNRATLNGLPGVYVVVEKFKEAKKQAGFDESTFQTDVELKLRMAGIKVLSEQEFRVSPVRPWLYLMVNAAHSQPDELACFSLLLEMNQRVHLASNGALTTGVTWSTGSLGRGDLSDVRTAVKDRVDAFINAWLSVNPKEQGP